MDFIMEMTARDNPEEFEFVRPGRVKPLAAWEEKAAWERVLSGASRERWLAPMMPSKEVLQRAKEMAEMGMRLRAGQGVPPLTTNPDITNIGQMTPK